jgi:hypothetical protein
MDKISPAQQTNAAIPSPNDTKPETMDMADTESLNAVRKVEEATSPSKDAQHGVQNVEAVTLSWSKTSLKLAFVSSVSTFHCAVEC